MSKENSARLKLLTSMVIYGTVSLFVKNISLPSAAISMYRGFIGAPFLLLVMLVTRKKISLTAIKKNLLPLVAAGAMLGLNWMLLFEAYKYTSVATSTLCYYVSPVFLIVASVFIFNEKLTVKKVLCVLAALAGMMLISGFLEENSVGGNQLKGILLALAAALLYAGIVIVNKGLKDISPYERTVAQLLASSLVMLVYNLFSGNLQSAPLDGTGLLLLAVLGIVHTGFAYYLFFGSTADLSAQSLAIIGYVDPVVAVLISAFIFREGMGIADVIGAVLIIGAAIISELPSKEKG